MKCKVLYNKTNHSLLMKGQRMQENADKMALIEEIEILIESDPNAPISSFSMLEFLELDDLVSVRETLLRSKMNRSSENDAWFDELCKK